MQSSSPIAAAGQPAPPASIRPASILRRAIFGLLALAVGILGFAWLFHNAIQPSTAAKAVATTAPQIVGGETAGGQPTARID